MIYIICPFFNEEKNVSKFLSSFPIREDLFFILINDGSKDETLSEINKYVAENLISHKIINHKENVGLERAILSGLINSYEENSYYAVMDTDLQDPPELLFNNLSKLENNDLINFSRKDRKYDTYIKRKTAKIYYNLMSLSINKKKAKSLDMGNFKLFRSSVILKIINKKKYKRSFRIDVLNNSKNPIYIFYSRGDRIEGTTNYNYRKLIIEALKSTQLSFKLIILFFFYLLKLPIVILIAILLFIIKLEKSKYYKEPTKII